MFDKYSASFMLVSRMAPETFLLIYLLAKLKILFHFYMTAYIAALSPDSRIISNGQIWPLIRNGMTQLGMWLAAACC
jgi:hypothetical protein